jgi:hypothetical protein
MFNEGSVSGPADITTTVFNFSSHVVTQVEGKMQPLQLYPPRKMQRSGSQWNHVYRQHPSFTPKRKNKGEYGQANVVVK